MKKLLILGVFLFLFAFIPEVDASETYDTFQEIQITKGNMLSDFSEKEYKSYYKKVEKRKFWGWRTYVVNKNIKAKFVSETVFSYYNNGETPITYKYQLSESKVNKYSISATGSIGYDMNGEVKKFKHKLGTELKIDYNSQVSLTKDEQTKLEILIDPKTVANLKIVGEGKITNGVGAYYICWIRSQKGGFEYFVVTTQYPRLEVLPI